MKRRGWVLIFLLLLIAAIGVLLNLRRGEETAAPILAAEAKAASTANPAEQEAKATSTGPRAEREAKAGSEDLQRSATAEPAKQRSPEEIRKSLEAKARETVEKGLGGATEEDKQALMAAIREFEALMAGGLSDQHPRMLTGLAEFSRKLDRLSAYDEAAWKADAVAFLQLRLSEVEALADGESWAALHERWLREQTRDDLPEAILLRVVRPFGPTSTQKEGLRDELKKWIQTFEGGAK